MFPFNFQLSVIILDFLDQNASCSRFSVAMGDSGSLCLLRHLTSTLSELTIINQNLFCSILLKFSHDEAGLLRNKFCFCRCVVAINAKVINRFWSAWAQPDFVIRDFLFTRRNDLSNEYKMISVPRRISSEKKDFWW